MSFPEKGAKRKRDTSKVQDELGSLGAAVSERLERVEHSTTELENKVFIEIGGVKENLDRFEEPFVKLEGKVMGALKELQVSIEAMQEDLTFLETPRKLRIFYDKWSNTLIISGLETRLQRSRCSHPT